MRRRTFITIFMADKSAYVISKLIDTSLAEPSRACMQNQLIMLKKEDCDTLYFRDL